MKSHNNAYSVSILVNGKPVTEVDWNSGVFIEGRKNSPFKLKFENHLSERVLVIPSVDGINTIDGELCGEKSQGYVVNGHDKLVISGWTVDSSTVAKFIFKSQRSAGNNQTYAEAMDTSTENQGLIGFMVFKEKPTISYRNSPSHNQFFGNSPRGQQSGWYSSTTIDTTVYGDSAGAPLSNDPTYSTTSCDNPVPTGEESLGTGFGKATNFVTKTVSFDRQNVPDEIMVYNYDSLNNLKKLGVPVHLFKEHYTKPLPSAFPKSPDVVARCKIPSGWKG